MCTVHACAFNSHLGQNVNVHEGFHNFISTYRFKTIFSRRFGTSFTKDNERLWCHATKCLPNFYSPMYTCMPLLGRLVPVGMMHVGSQPKMLSCALNELFHVYCGMGADNDDGLCMVAQEMLSLTLLHCMECRGKPMPSSQTSGTWAVYDGMLELGHLPPLKGQHDWSQIYKGGRSKDHCPSCTMSSFSTV